MKTSQYTLKLNAMQRSDLLIALQARIEDCNEIIESGSELTYWKEQIDKSRELMDIITKTKMELVEVTK